MKWVWILAVAVLGSCGGAGESADDEPEQTTDMLTGTSLYNLTSNWIAQDSSELHLSDLRGRPQILAMIYTSCQLACPRIISDMRLIETQLGADAAEVGFVLVSIDPERDTPAHLDTFSRENEFDMSRWKLLNGEPADIMELAAVLGVKYKKTTPMDFAHSNIITVLSDEGEVVYQHEGLGSDLSETVQRIRKLINKPS